MIDTSIPQLSLLGLSTWLGEDARIVANELECEEIEELEEEDECQINLKK